RHGPHPHRGRCPYPARSPAAGAARGRRPARAVPGDEAPGDSAPQEAARAVGEAVVPGATARSPPPPLPRSARPAAPRGPPLARLHRVVSWSRVRRRDKLESLSVRLRALSPLSVLERGYAIVSTDEGVIREAGELSPGERVRVRLARGSFEAIVSGAPAKGR